MVYLNGKSLLLAQEKASEMEFKFMINFQIVPIYAGVFYFSGNASYSSCFCISFWLPSLPSLLPWNNVSRC
jgi:hypothetical protein